MPNAMIATTHRSVEGDSQKRDIIRFWLSESVLPYGIHLYYGILSRAVCEELPQAISPKLVMSHFGHLINLPDVLYRC